MRRCILLQVLLLGACSAAAPGAAVQEKAETGNDYFMRLSSPKDTQSFEPGATCTVTGSLLLPKSAKAPEYLRLRAFQPGREGFVIAQEDLVTLEKATKRVTLTKTGQRLYAFQAELKLPKDRGEYLLRVDCLDFREKKYSDGLVATQSLFIRIPAKAQGKEQAGERK
jgi:hypothetical protein